MIGRKIRKRDGALVSFDERKLERSILQAARHAGQDNPQLARDLAGVVSTYVREHYENKTASSHDLRTMVHKVLNDTGYPDIAKSYQSFSKSRPASTPDLFPQELVVIDASTRDEVSRWDKERIHRALIADHVEEPAATEIADAVERTILSLKLSRLSTTLVRELIGQELMQRGIRAPVDNHRVLGIPKADLQKWLSHPDGMDPETVCTRLGELTLKQYALQELYAREVADAHLEGRIHIHHLENPFKFYWGRIPWKALAEPLTHADIRMDLVRRHFAEALEVGPLSEEAIPAWAGLPYPRLIVDSPVAGFAALRSNLHVSRIGPWDSSVLVRALQRGGVMLSFEKGSRFGSEEFLIVGQAVSINLPQLYLRSKKVFDELDTSVELAVLAQLQKRDVLSGFLHSLAPTLRLPVPALRFSIGVQGLNELVRLMTGHDLGTDEETLRLGLQILSYTHGLVKESAMRHRVNVSLDEILSHRAVERLSRIDARLHPQLQQSGAYTSGYHLPARATDLARRLACETRLGALVEGAAVLLPQDLRPTMTLESLTSFLSEAARDARVRCILVP
jgi:anaerobic ribonucleoside-triphosphate reductase